MKLVTIILKENTRIKEKLKEYNSETEKNLYMEGYKAALIYADKLAKYQRFQGQKSRLDRRLKSAK